MYSQMWESNIPGPGDIAHCYPIYLTLNSQIWEYIFGNLGIYFRKSWNNSQISELFPDQTLISDC